MGPDHMVANVGGIAAGNQGRGFRSVCGRQLVDGLRPHAGLRSPGGGPQPVRALPVFHRGVCVLPAVHRRVCPRDSRSIA